MPKWEQEGNEVVWGGETPTCVSADKYYGATEIVTRHNADIDALTEEIQQFRDAYAHDREIMADNVAYIDSYEKRIEVMEATLDAIREVVPEGDNTKWSSWQMVTKIHAILYPKEPTNG